MIELPEALTIGQSVMSNDVVFQAVWNTLDQGYGLFGAKAVDWDALGERYRKRAGAAATEAGLFNVLAEMLSHLRDKHVWLIGHDRAWNCRMGSFCPLADVDQAIKAWKAPFSEDVIYSRYVRHQVVFSSEIAGGFLHPSVGYLRITAFPDCADSVGLAMDKALEMLGTAQAIVVDVRDNRGGSDRGAKAAADRFADCHRLYMTASVRSGKGRDQLSEPVEWWIAPDGPRQFLGPVVLIVNRDTFSAGESFALAMRILPHVTIVGERTAGAFSDAVDAILPNGWQLTYSIGEWRDAQGRLWEGQGLSPDVMVTNSLAGLSSGCDEVLDWTIERLMSA